MDGRASVASICRAEVLVICWPRRVGGKCPSRHAAASQLTWQKSRLSSCVDTVLARCHPAHQGSQEDCHQVVAWTRVQVLIVHRSLMQ